MPGTPLRGAARLVLIVAAVLLLLLVGSFIFAGQFVITTINYVVGNLANRSGMSVFLVRSLVIAATIPFFYAVAQFTRSIIGLLGFGWNPLGIYKNKYGAIIVAYIAIFYGGMYWASLDAYAYKYCVDTPEGISVSDGPGMDPVYGNEFQPCSIAQIEVLRNGKGKLAAPRELHIANPASYAWFDVAGRPRVWYAQDLDGRYQFFDHSGVSPTTGHPLQPVTEEVIQQAKKQLAAAAASKHSAEARQAAAAAKAQDAADAQDLTKQAQAQFDAGDYKGAMDNCDRALSKAPNNAECTTIRQRASVKLAQQLVTKGQSQLERGQIDEAVWSADEAMKLDPANRNAAKLKLLAIKLKPRASN
ncbi:MAG TPA: hypothetical protein VLW48_03930 [Candidatus Bathyarchaeia archaeon]|nr:hypothetical protein [Candidatus Bathyarchaeia archaeon]